MQLLRAGNKFQVLFFSTLIILYGVLIFQYLYNRSVWNDEAFLVLTISNVNARDLLLPLDYYQVAPVLFLQIEKLAFVLFGDSEYALRLFPLLCALAAVPLFYSFCLRFTGNRVLSLFAMILFVLTPGVIFYSSEVKQYCSDLFVTLLLYNAAFTNSTFFSRNRILKLSIAGVIAAFLSNVSVIILFTIGLYFLYSSWKFKKIRREHWIPGIAWIIAFGINYLLFIRDHPHAEYMKNFWQISFMPVNIFSEAFRHFIGRSGLKIFSQLLPSIPGGYFYLFTAFLFFAGIFMMFREKRFLLIYLCLAPILIHLGLSAIQFYPFEQRLFLYHVPSYILSITFGLFSIINNLITGERGRILAAGLCMVLISFKTFMSYPIEHDKIKAVIRYINATHKPGESLYVSTGAVPGIKYYIQRRLAQFNDMHISFGKERVYDKNDFIKNINNVHGNVWVVSSDIFPIRHNQEEEMEIISVMKKRGKIIGQKDFKGNTVFLFELP